MANNLNVGAQFIEQNNEELVVRSMRLAENMIVALLLAPMLGSLVMERAEKTRFCFFTELMNKLKQAGPEARRRPGSRHKNHPDLPQASGPAWPLQARLPPPRLRIYLSCSANPPQKADYAEANTAA